MQNDHLKKSIESLQYIIELQKSLYQPSSTINQTDALLSKMYYRLECDDSLEPEVVVFQSIEPLIGLLRDPLTMCSHTDLPENVKIAGEEAVQSKRFFLLGPSAPYINHETSTPTIPPWLLKPSAQVILFDIGSSYFNGMDSTAVTTSAIGTRWFYEYFRSKSLSFDRIIAFEASKYEPKSYWDQIPDDVIGKLTFINTGVEVNGKLNPWNILKTIAKPEDYVIIKLDIDTPALETALCNQILNDTSISSLIDEMFFEMHVTVNEMIPYWGAVGGELKDTYILFRKLRELGIRMHSWP